MNRPSMMLAAIAIALGAGCDHARSHALSDVDRPMAFSPDGDTIAVAGGDVRLVCARDAR